MLIGVLIVLALAALGAVQTGQRLVDARQRANEEELLFVGEQYREAIQSYWRESPRGVHAWPVQFEDLIEDRRFPEPRRHLRKLFADPMSPETPWGVVRQGNALIGVYSQSIGVPFRQAGFSNLQQGFEAAQTYAAWRFVASVRNGVAGPSRPGTSQPPIPGNTATPIPSPSQKGAK
jgi:type II secretory pathway pseudopilin PulG